MCYPCTKCNSCGKFNPDSHLYVPPANIPCMVCGNKSIDRETGICQVCGTPGFLAPGTRQARGQEH